MGLSWQQGPLAPGAIGRFLVPDPLPERLLFAEPLRRRMRVRFGGAWIADSEDIMRLHEPGRYQVAYFPPSDIADGVLEPSPYITRHADLGATSWYSVRARGQAKPRAAWQHTELPAYASELRGRAAFAWRAMDAFYEEDERTASGHAADFYHRIDTRQASRHLIVRDGHRVVADTTRPLALYESGFAPRWHVPRADLDQAALTATQGADVLSIQGPGQLLRHRGRTPGGMVVPGRLDRGPAHLRPGVLRTRQDRCVPRRHPAAAGTRPDRVPARHRPRPAARRGHSPGRQP